MGMKALEGRKVIGFEHAWTGPVASMMLADMGADVVKVEEPHVGDHVRNWTRNDLQGLSPHFLSANRNKRSIIIDLKSPDGRKVALDLIAQADVLVENFSPGVAKALGIGYDDVSALNAGIVYCSVNGFGSEGPYSRHRAYDLLMQAEGGIISVTGQPDGTLAKVGVPVVDIVSGMVGAFSIVCALMEKDRTGKGRLIDVSMLEVAASTMAFNFFSYALSGVEPRPLGTAHPLLAPYEVFETKDGHIALSILTEAHWHKFCELIGRQELANDPRYHVAPMRVEHRDELGAELKSVFYSRPADTWVHDLNAAGLACSKVNGMNDLLGHPQLQARGFFEEWTLPGIAKPVMAPGAPWFAGASQKTDRLPPAHGEQTAEILSDWLNLTIDEVRAIAESGGIAGKDIG
jgi:crotonobetainyl-CoA:carnitine CoA-transferase CaiB-like acyl-CoA transferase